MNDQQHIDTDAARQRFAHTRLGLSGDASFADLTPTATLDSTCELGATLCDELDASRAECERLHEVESDAEEWRRVLTRIRRTMPDVFAQIMAETKAVRQGGETQKLEEC